MPAPTQEMEPVEPQSLKKLSFKSLKRALDLFSPIHGQLAPPDPESKKTRLSHKINVNYKGIKNANEVPRPVHSSSATDSTPSNVLALPGTAMNCLLLLYVISGHLGWVRSVAFDPSNTWFCTGSADRTIKIWDVGTGRLKLTLTGHIEQVRGLAVSQRHTYMFSAGDDKQVKCWDLEQNKVVRSYHGHLSGVYCLAIHPTIDLLLTGGRDSVCRVWDVRTKVQVFALSGHDNTVCSVFTRPTDPQVVTGSHDTTIKFWDLRYGKTMLTLTHHKKSVRAMALHPTEHCFASASADNIKKFSLPKGEFLHNMLSQQKTIINTMAVNEDGVMATGGDNGSIWFWDWKSGHNFQQTQTIVQPGSLDSEAGIYALSYDITGSRLVTCEADKTIKMWKEDETATPETHPLNFKPPKDIRRF
ncbi:PP1/PP2A phosphatases pleiotropic regulator PRL1, putative [Ricinus communis]|uniref:PP1/PP2A phosphatases pleiotropic regulator PRL1, putative n=1 Tax=Ricinus communis TaxID=3988 RepID=B9RT69_RICCO|nr:PP1/PP2A phosphatases pleiotropic regulator PRL1, putative [Ricinus communis]